MVFGDVDRVDPYCRVVYDFEDVSIGIAIQTTCISEMHVEEEVRVALVSMRVSCSL